ncbi:retrovirus-related Pol polyprotein from transposon 297 [Elysia marginata]|uniref:Retrovirus-related Pol polyprotein from transposon 297 n=1 Tax=Elysia marginata TaxID=1093978 RepID=A0AAV4EY07_9GAST|nr:retrovirus-related Pol polyprotein from transposon 297 [Elysia marginata]
MGAGIEMKAVKQDKSELQYKSRIGPPRNQPPSSSYKRQPCRNCGRLHGENDCPARGKSCYYCKSLNHFSKMCRKLQYQQRKLHAVSTDDDPVEENQDDFEYPSFATLQVKPIQLTQNNEAFATIIVTLPDLHKKAQLRGKIDTGAQGNALPLRLFKQMFPKHVDKDGLPLKDKITPSNVKLAAYGGFNVQHFGTISMYCCHKGKRERTTFYITEDNGDAIFGLPTAQNLKLVTINCQIKNYAREMNKENILQDYSDCFDVIGKFQGQYHIATDTTVPPVIASKLTAPLRELLSKSSVFQWTGSHQDAFDKIKCAISDQVTLAYFDVKKPITLQVDASLQGLGATILQGGQPVAFASKALPDEETRYANIERELLAVVYGCERFHTYLYGQSFIVESDHKPLESIHLKHLTSAPPRLQRMLLRLHPYDLRIVYKPGQDVSVADALSRLSPEEKPPIFAEQVRIHTILSQFSESIIQRIQEETA